MVSFEQEAIMVACTVILWRYHKQGWNVFELQEQLEELVDVETASFMILQDLMRHNKDVIIPSKTN